MHTTVAAGQEPWSKRPRFAPRQLLDAERLNAALDDELERQRLLNIALHGWGVVFGFGVGLPDAGPEGRARNANRVLVTCGLALDPFGRMVHTDDRWVSLAELEGPAPTHEGAYTLLVHHAERLDPPDHDACSGSGPQWREYGVAFTLRSGCEPVHDGCPELTDACLTRTDYVRRRIGSAEGPPGRSPDLAHACDRPGSLRATRCGSWCYDPAAGVPIACLEICDRGAPRGEGGGEEHGKSYEDHRPRPKQECDEPCLTIGGVCTDDCSPVHHVYRSPLLRELLSCCDVDLPRVDHVSWQEWLGLGSPVPWDELSDRLQAVDEGQAEDGFAIWFTRPVWADTLTTASVILTTITQERLADYWIDGRVPIEVRPLAVTGRLARGVQLVPQQDWLGAEVRDSRSSLTDGVRVEITLRGQLLRDDCGHMLDSIPTELGCAPCQGRPGDDLIWAFEVAERGAYDRPRTGRKSTRQGEKT
jgi:hypothetical protein